MVKERIANFGIFLDVFEFLHFGWFLPFFKKIGFWGILGPPSYGIGATIRIGREMLCLPYAGFFLAVVASMIWLSFTIYLGCNFTEKMFFFFFLYFAYLLLWYCKFPLFGCSVKIFLSLVAPKNSILEISPVSLCFFCLLSPCWLPQQCPCLRRNLTRRDERSITYLLLIFVAGKGYIPQVWFNLLLLAFSGEQT